MKRVILITVLSAAFITGAYGLASAHGERGFRSLGYGHMGNGYDGHMGGSFGQIMYNLGK